MPACCALFSHLLRLKVVLLLWCGESGIVVVVVVTDGGEEETGEERGREREGEKRERDGRWGCGVGVGGGGNGSTGEEKNELDWRRQPRLEKKRERTYTEEGMDWVVAIDCE
ncbi:hypothetical protein RHGRI_023416 [Rhododendron griersonianum]|uniref:Uncharacterized protein n=1 Tax=Rhododendron griersonianum TaxID=479676 RepID=A0AAV6J7Z9_9ERIC|nr:hypothetical protein RHGRI_023416 [Rhododendron griersonianum]